MSFWGHSEPRPGLTEDERELRDRAWHFLHAARNDAAPLRVAYYDSLVRRRGPEASWTALRDDIASDARLFRAFRSVAARVESTDGRRIALLAYQTEGGADAAGEVTARVADNRAVIDTVAAALTARIETYIYAGDRLAVEAPSPLGAKARIAIEQLRREIGPRRRYPPAGPLVIRY